MPEPSTISPDELAEILRLHKLWILGDPKGQKADLRFADLRSADLRFADLRSADLRYADLGSANLRYADLGSANLRSADLGFADLRYADLRYANLGLADLRYANLGYADLGSANLGYADLWSANLRYANLGLAKGFWRSHAVLSEILWRAAGAVVSRQMLAAFIGRQTAWCWEQWSSFDHPERDWAIGELAKWIVDGDDTVPAALTAAIQSAREKVRE
jgi:hypothetical protein